ncbi:hypothetical protein [Acetobacter oeni]|uniref:Uncharacterized protein n=1 Tax=Acetobacter oeni TaxID=304077 RepID=A0A511XJR7_9PROT|nr:hypothetical protein [Acetobacter oeni]MBB3883386.1 hypothetical protein [Acetobacter oeni]NHO19365.1 hypothetical protein [Acetobacter oeni]GBR03921.1 hypothetical protein AA21952_1225 [Acetobacter oeni LMG 21952]GEN63168.1 hypothetical protein AOE01nite_13920 [Acetobacter oeni]
MTIRIKEYCFIMSQRSDGMDMATFGKFSASSRNGASCKLARALVDAGAPDAPVRLMRGGRPVITCPSLRTLSEQTFTEATGHPRMVKWVPHPMAEGVG